MATHYFLIKIGLQFQWLEFHIKIHGMAGKQCAFLTKRLVKGHFFLKLGLEFQLQLSGHPVFAKNIAHIKCRLVKVSKIRKDGTVIFYFGKLVFFSMLSYLYECYFQGCYPKYHTCMYLYRNSMKKVEP